MKEENSVFNPASLRLKAEKLLNSVSSNSGLKLSEAETLELIHELLIHQTEFELHITEHQKTDKALTESRELYEDLVSYQSAGIYRILVEKQKEGKSIIESSSIEFVSDRFCELLEVDKNKFLNNAIHETFCKMHPDDLQEFIKSNEIAQQSLESYVWEGRLLINNRIKWLRFESSPRKLENGSIRWTGIAIDISKHKQDEEVILNKLRELEIYYELAIKREHKMIALKSEINLLLERLGENRKY